MGLFKEGMYVRCPIDSDSEENPRVHLLGQIIEIEQLRQEALVVFHDLSHARKYYEFVPKEKWFPLNKLKRSKILNNSDVIVRGPNYFGKVLSPTTKVEQYYLYYVEYIKDGKNEVKEISEYYLQASFTRANYSPLKQMINYELHNPFWYVHRNMVTSSLHTLKNATYGFETLVGSRVFLLPHQVDTIVRAIAEEPCRFMLADEVGLGKTIEACVIMKGLKERLGMQRTLIIVPDSLVDQWQNELSYKMWLNIPIWDQQGYSDQNGDLIFPLESINTPEGHQILSQHWDICIVDETHRLLTMKSEYKSIFKLSQKVKHILLLTATPIQQRQAEYHHLLALLVPNQYGKMTTEEFKQLLEKQKYLRGRVHRLVRDIDDYIEDEMAEEYLEELEEISEKLNDRAFTKLVNAIDIEAEDMGLDAVKLALAYIGEHYQIERHIIRHRRMELEKTMPTRQLELIKYTPAGADYGFYEYDTYQQLLSYLSKLVYNTDSVLIGEYIKLFLGAMFSSPWALEAILKQRRSILAKQSFIDDCLMVPNTPRHIRSWQQQLLSSIKGFAGEQDHINTLLKTTHLWLKAVETEFNKIDELFDDPDQIKGRLLKLLDYLSQAYDNEKFVIFTAWQETIEVLVRVMSNIFGREAVATFHSGVIESKLQVSIDRFQSDPKCRFIVCDELGGEGRNFQMADAIIHVDLPWSPTQLEQRIGRLDRIGRHKEVLSVVACAEDTIEEGLFNLWHQGLNIFRESCSGLEIALGEIQEQINKALQGNLSDGLADVLESIVEQSEKIKNMVDEERYYDMARQLDRRITDQLSRLIQKFDKNEGQSLYNTMMSWTSSTGLIAEKDYGNQIVTFRPSNIRYGSMLNTMFIPPSMNKLWERSRKKGEEIKGTFSRNLAIMREELVFFAPSDPFFDAIVNNADECARGRCCAIAIRADIPQSWQGLVFTWAALIDPRPLLALGKNIQYLALAQGYMPLEHIITLEGLSEREQQIDEATIKQIINQGLLNFNNPKKVAHLGKRHADNDFLQNNRKYNKSNIDWFKAQYPADVWSELVNNAYKSSRKKVSVELAETVEFKRAQADFKRRINGIKASALYYGSERESQTNKELLQIYQALLYGLNKPIRHLESVAFVWVVGKDYD